MSITESAEQVLWSCCYAEKVWEDCDLGPIIHNTVGVSSIDFLWQVLKKGGVETMQQVVTVAWSI